MNTVVSKINNWIIFIKGIYIDLNKEISHDVQSMLDKNPIEIIAILKTSIDLLKINSPETLFTIVQQKAGITDKDLAALSPQQIDKLRRYSNYFFEVSKII